MSERVSRASRRNSGGSGAFARLAAAFVAPRELAEEDAEEIHRIRAAEVEAAVARPASVAVLCRASDAWPIGGALALGAGGGAVVVAWGDDVAAPATRAPAWRAARKLAETLAARGHGASATGRLVHVLAEDPAEAVRVAVAADPARCVTVVAGPRDEAIDALLRDQDRVLVDATEAVADLALTSLAQADVPARRLALADAPSAAKALAAAGVGLTPHLRAAVAEALR